MSEREKMPIEMMREGIAAGRTLIQEEWSHPDDIENVDKLIAEGFAKEEDGWRWHHGYQCERRRIVRATP